MGLLYSSRRALLGGQKGLPPLDFDPALLTFTAGMDKRLAPGPFDRAPIAQGKWDTTGTPDVVTYPRGDLLGNATGAFYANVDPYQASISFWITPEWDGNDGLAHHLFQPENGNWAIAKLASNTLSYEAGNVTMTVDVSGWTAGTTYHVVCRHATKGALDGTNYLCISVNDAHTFGGTSAPTNHLVYATIDLFTSKSSTLSIDSLIEGFTVYRRVLWDGAYGDYIGIADEINAIWAAGAGLDPTEVTGSWDVVFCLPTNQANEALQTTGEAWSHPHSSNSLDASTGAENCFACDAGYMAEPYAVMFDGNNTVINCSSDADIDDIMDAECTLEAWIRADSYGEGSAGRIFDKTGGGAAGFRLSVHNTRGIHGVVFCATTDADSRLTTTEFAADGKWHHIVMYFNDAGDRKIYLAIDGRWVTSYASQTAGVGAIVSDAAETFKIGNRTGSDFTFEGAIGWCAVSNNDRHTQGTDFIAPRAFPADDANYLASWPMNEGTGATIDNIGNQGGGGSGAANRDGTLSNGTWISTWEFEGTPPILPILEYDGAATSTVITDAARIQDLHDAAMTVEAWVRWDGPGGANAGRVFDKRSTNNKGWMLCFNTTTPGQLRGLVECATTDADSKVTLALTTPWGTWNHIAMQFDDAGDRKIYIWLNGVPVTYGEQTAGVGAIVSDVGNDLYHGNRSAGGTTWDGAFGGWARVSSVARYTNGVPFVPPDMANPPAADANTAWQSDFPDGAGTTLTDASAGANNGTITFGTGRWYNTPDAEIVASGHRMYPWGYMLASDAANDGVTVYSATGLAAGSNYVARVPVKYGYSRRGQPSIQAYDETNGAAITTFNGPPLVGTHLVGAASATLVVTGAVFPYSLVGGVVYNIPDGSVGTITAVGGTNQDTITAPLAGGGSNDWNVGEQYMIVPPNESSWSWTEHFCFELPTIARNGAAADCTAFSIKLMNASGEGVLFWQQAEVQSNLLDGPSLDTGAGNPWIPDGWLVYGAPAAGELAQDAAEVHSGASCLEAVALDTDEGVQQTETQTVGDYISVGGWGRESAGSLVLLYDAAKQTALTTTLTKSLATDVWTAYMGVTRHRLAAHVMYLISASAAASGRWDDPYAFELDPITLTVTPASEANSAESSGLRIDGRDVCTQPIPAGAVAASEGWIRWNCRLRHASANLDLFGAADPVLVEVWGDANNNASAYVQAANTIRLSVTSLAVTTTADWACAGDIVADTEYLFEFRWSGSALQLYQDGVLQQQVVAAIAFGTIPTTIHWGCDQAGDGNIDAVYIAS